MKKTTKTIAGAIVIMVGLCAVGYVVLGSNYFEEPVQFGSWGQQIIVNYADGSTESLSIIATNPFKQASVSHNGVAIVSLTYVLSAKASQVGTSYTNVVIDYSLYSIQLLAGTKTITKPFTGTTTTVPVDNAWHIVCSVDITAGEIEAGLTPATYQMVISGQGSLKYKGNIDATWSTATNPSSIQFAIIITSDIVPQLIVDFSNDVTFTPSGGSTITCYQCQGTTLASQTVTGTTCPSGWFATPPTCGGGTGNQDLSTYILSSSGDITRTATSATATNMPGNSASFLRKDIAIGTSDFTLKFDIIASRLDLDATSPSGYNEWSGASLCVDLSPSSTAITPNDLKILGNGILFTFIAYHTSTGYAIKMMKLSSVAGGKVWGTDYIDHWAPPGQTGEVILNQKYTVTIQRIGTALGFKIANSAGTVIHDGGITNVGSIGGTTPTNIQNVVILCGSEGWYSYDYTLSSGTISNVSITTP